MRAVALFLVHKVRECELIPPLCNVLKRGYSIIDEVVCISKSEVEDGSYSISSGLESCKTRNRKLEVEFERKKTEKGTVQVQVFSINFPSCTQARRF